MNGRKLNMMNQENIPGTFNHTNTRLHKQECIMYYRAFLRTYWGRGQFPPDSFYLCFSQLSGDRGSGCLPFANKLGVPCTDLSYQPDGVSSMEIHTFKATFEILIVVTSRLAS